MKKLLHQFLMITLIFPISQGLCSIPDSTASQLPQVISMWTFAKMFLVLAIVLVLIWFILKMLRSMTGLPGTGKVRAELIGGIALGTKRSIQFLRAGNSLLIIGVTDHHISLISKVTDENEIAQIVSPSDPTDTGRISFSRVLSKFVNPTSLKNKNER